MKLDNVLIDKSTGIVKICDFGQARELRKEKA